MDDDDYPYYRNDYWDEAADRQRNARRPPPRRVIQVANQGSAPWRPPYQQAQPIVVNTARPGIRDMPTGLLAEVAAQAFVALQPLPTPPPAATDDVRSSLNNLVVYQTALAQYTKRNEQIRTLGYIARLFV